MSVRVVCLGFAHVHAHSLLKAAADHPDALVVGVCTGDPERRTVDPEGVARAVGLGEGRVYADFDRCVNETDPDLAIICSAPSDHAADVERAATHNLDILVEKPFAPTLDEADRMLDATAASGSRFAVNWPLAWYPPHRTTERLIEDGVIGEVQSVHYHDGNRGSGRFAGVTTGDDGELVGTDGPVDKNSWWFDPNAGGGSLVDYLGYGTTLATWFRDGDLPTAVTAANHVPSDAAVDTHSTTIAHYETGLSTFRTSWETISDPWEHQPTPRCGFEVRGERGAIRSYDYDDAVTVQTTEDPAGRRVKVDELSSPLTGAIEYFLHCIKDEQSIEFGPLSAQLNRDSQRIVDAARRSADIGETVSLPD